MEGEFAKVIKKGVALGVVKKKNDTIEWDLEEEVMMGFDFNGNEEELYEVVAELEREEEVRGAY